MTCQERVFGPLLNDMRRGALFFALILGAAQTNVLASLINGSFSDGLNSWTTHGDVTAATGAAVLGDDAATHSVLYQLVDWPMGSFSLEFDFQNNLSLDHPAGTFSDAFFASLYTTDHPETFDPDHGGFDSAVGLFDMDANGIYHVNANATITASPLGGTWFHYSGTLSNPSGTVIPYFEEFDLNFVNADSWVGIDNVQMQLVPEPTALGLAATGALAFLFRAWRRRGRAWPRG
jgi:hypothetical protein